MSSRSDSHLFSAYPCHWALVAPLSVVDIAAKKIWLSTKEQERCERFRREEDQQRFILAHALKRYCLSRRLNLPADQLRLSTGAKGKPYCTNANAPEFNLSHAGNYVVLGLSDLAYVGVDIEVSHRDISENVFSRVLSVEQQQILHHSSHQQYDFICYWTQKEAISKALGLGLSIDFATIDCSGLEGEFETRHSTQTLLVATQQWDEEHMLSVASTHNTPMRIVELLAWDDNLIVDSDQCRTNQSLC